jgi:hypothetical protein
MFENTKDHSVCLVCLQARIARMHKAQLDRYSADPDSDLVRKRNVWNESKEARLKRNVTERSKNMT